MGVFLSILVLLAVATAAQANDVVVQVKGGALVIIGDDEISTGSYALKDMARQEQTNVSRSELAARIRTQR